MLLDYGNSSELLFARINERVLCDVYRMTIYSSFADLIVYVNVMQLLTLTEVYRRA
jgi:hypothetical protein